MFSKRWRRILQLQQQNIIGNVSHAVKLRAFGFFCEVLFERFVGIVIVKLGLAE